ncbi:unnamed protein product [Didymodactylos carnosus]|uniref:NHL repeat containing protein n=1 Tax=Didymodactylos carnosus TaxID=1234261 RepID=A0A815H5N3_9BILA|nr:unnamed protein product [Didymodactylos carnosus]CAF1347741.1 unnamed protein product [Didymodactylos carnosus]CAF3858790.1 unnamed protein product [Didymodactylos carnosus]CAF4215034.1 unnamed protein product [Didymodactylos carnosus]
MSTDEYFAFPHLNCAGITGSYWNSDALLVVSRTYVINGIYIKNDVLYIADSSGVILKTTSPLNSTSPYATTSVVSTGLVSPNAPIIDSQGYMYIPDFGNFRVFKYFNATYYGVIAGITGVSGASLNQLNSAYALAFDSTESNIFVSDNWNSRVLIFSVNSTMGTNGTLIAGGNGSGYSTNQLYVPLSLAYDSVSNFLYTCNPYGHTVSQWVPGASNGTFIIGTSNIAGSTPTTLNTPQSLIMDQYQNLYVTDEANSRIMMYCAGFYANGGIQILTFSYHPKFIALDSSMNIYLIEEYGTQVFKHAKL